MRKLLKCALAVTLAAGLIPVAAFAGVSGAENDAVGEVDVTLHREDALASTEFTITMAPTLAGNGESARGTATAKALETKSSLVLPSVENGTYTLELTAPHYLPYTVNDVVIDDDCAKLDVYELISVNEGRDGETSPLYGVMPVGDLDGDGDIDDADADLMSEAVESSATPKDPAEDGDETHDPAEGDGEDGGIASEAAENEAAGEESASYDLTGDGKVDLADLAIVVRNAGATHTAAPYKGTSSKKLVSAVDAESITTTGTQTLKKADGSSPENVSNEELAKALLSKTQDATVALSPEKEGSISESNPVSVDMAAHTNSTLSEAAEAVVIAAPSPKMNADDLTHQNASTMTAGTVTVEGNTYDEDGKVTDEEVTIEAKVGDAGASQASAYAAAATSTPMQAKGVKIESDGSVVIDLGTRVAVKRVAIRITAVSDRENPNLAEIATVEFLQDFAERIPEPQLSIPSIDESSIAFTTTNNSGCKSVTLSWNQQPNVAEYEVSVSGAGYDKTAMTSDTSYTFAGSESAGTVKAGNDYTFKVRSASGDWRSDWSTPVTKHCDYNNVPATPEYVTATGGVQSLDISWRCKFDGQRYQLQYAKGSASSINWNSPAVSTVGFDSITTTSYRLEGLEGGVKYAFRVQAENDFGQSGWSNAGEADTLTSSLAAMPKYDLLNVDDPDNDNIASTHIERIEGASDKSYTIYKADGTTVTNANATAADWNAIIDNDSNSYLHIADWDSGVMYANFRGPRITLDEPTEIDTIRIMPSDRHQAILHAVDLCYRNGDNGLARVKTQLSTKYDNEGRMYYEIVASEKFTADYLEVRMRNFNSGVITIAELKLYRYNPLDDDIAAIFTDEQRTEVKAGVTESDVNALIERSNARQEGTASAAFPEGEAHPHNAMQMEDLNYALEFLRNGAAAETFTVDNQITAKNQPASGMAMPLSDYQSIGRVAAAGDTVVVYVTDTDGKAAKGTNVNLRLVATQMHPEVANWQSSAIQLKAGRNEIIVPRIGSYAQESGGSLYLQYTGAKGANNYTVRVTGGDEIPMLNVDGITGNDRTEAIARYMDELESHVARLETLHGEKHAQSSNASVSDYAFDNKNCILNYTDIQFDNMMYSLPADAVLSSIRAAAQASNVTDDTQELATSIEAMEQEIDYFYQFKGMNRAATDKNAYPTTRLNIRYHRMFVGAFMYAGGKHIGIEYGSTGSVFGLAPVTTDATGAKTSGTLSGWGISHEIGHVINAGAYVHAEVTNNVFAQLAKSITSGEGNDQFRTTYDKVYAAVAGGNASLAGDLAVQLAMYWQLHLAYDDAPICTLYGEDDDGIAQQQESLFYARLESYLREPSKAPHPLTITAGDQGFMQAACAAAGKNCLDFFRAWGLTPSAETEAYAEQFTEETRKIQYIDDDSRLYRIGGENGSVAGATVTASVLNAENQRVHNTNQVKLAITSNADESALLGYEIKRNGKVVAFVTPDKLQSDAGKKVYTDTIRTENNKTFVYTVTAVDRLLDESAPATAPEIKVQHDGSIDKSNWKATTNMASLHDKTIEKNDSNPESGYVNGNRLPGTETVSAIGAALDDKASTVYYGTSTGGNRPSVTIDMGKAEQVTALKFTPAAKDYAGGAAKSPAGSANPVTWKEDSELFKYRLFGYRVEVSLDGKSWTTAKEGEALTGNAANESTWQYQSDVIANEHDGSYTMYFNKANADGTNDPFMYTYDARYVRLSATNMSALAIAELDVLGPTSDNVELVPAGFGKLTSDYRYIVDYEKNANGEPDKTKPVYDTIPADSVVFYGEYRGDPAYNVVLLRDQNGTVLNGQQLFFADVPDKGYLGSVSDGRWIFWLEKGRTVEGVGELDQLTGMQTIQCSLYRVQNAETLAGQRITSTSLTMDVPSSIPDVTITDASTGGAGGGEAAGSDPSESPQATGNEGELAAMSASVRGDTVVTSLGSVHSIDDTDAAVADDGASFPSSDSAELALEGLAYGDSGSTSGEVANTPFLLAATDSGFEATVNVSESGIAARACFTLDPAVDDCEVSVAPRGNDNIYTRKGYDADGHLSVMAVARSGEMGKNASLLVSITGLTESTTLATERYEEMAAHSKIDIVAFDASSACFTPTSLVDPPVGPENPGGGSGSGGSGSGGGGGGGAVVAPDRDIANNTSRIAGDTAVHTSVAISKTAYPDGSDWVVIARSDDFEDAMSATAVAGALDCPILTTERTATSQEILAETYRLGAKNAFVIGGSIAIPADVEGDLARIGISSKRLAGQNAWDTSVECAKAVSSFGNKAGRNAIIATSGNFQDALSISSFAFKFAVPIFLTDANGNLPDEAKKTIAELGGNVYVAGGTLAVPSATAEGTFGDRVIRISGADGYDTSNQIATYMVKNGYLDNKAICLASGTMAAKGLDALSGAALASKNDAPVLLVSGNPAVEEYNITTIEGIDSEGTKGFVSKNATSLGKMFVLGGTLVIPDDVRTVITNLVK